MFRLSRENFLTEDKRLIEQFYFEGHSHFLSIRDNTISVPSISDDMKEHGVPGFLIISQDESFFNIYSKEFINSELIDKGKKLSKKI